MPTDPRPDQISIVALVTEPDSMDICDWPGRSRNVDCPDKPVFVMTQHLQGRVINRRICEKHLPRAVAVKAKRLGGA